MQGGQEYRCGGPHGGRGRGHGVLPHTLHPSPFTLHPEPCTLYPAPCILNPQPTTHNPQPFTLHPVPSALHTPPSTLNPQLSTLNPQPSTRNNQAVILNLKPCTRCAHRRDKPAWTGAAQALGAAVASKAPRLPRALPLRSLPSPTLSRSLSLSSLALSLTLYRSLLALSLLLWLVRCLAGLFLSPSLALSDQPSTDE